MNVTGTLHSPVSLLSDLWHDLQKTICSSTNSLAPRLALFSLIILSALPLHCGRKWLDSTDRSGVRRRRVRTRVRSALQSCSASVLRESMAVKPAELWDLRLSVKRWPSVLTGLGIRKAHQEPWCQATHLPTCLNYSLCSRSLNILLNSCH